MPTLNVGTFTRSVLLEATLSSGAFSVRGWRVQEHPVSSSPAQFDALQRGDLDLAITNPDNVLLYSGFADNPLGRRLDLTITTAIDRGLDLSLWARPDLADGVIRSIGVDVPVSGFALAAFALLERMGIDRDDVEVRALGSTPRRRVALARSEIDVTILGAGNEILAAEHGCRRLADVTDIGPYLGAVACRMTELASGRRFAADALSDALRRTANAVLDGEHGDLIVAAARRLLDLSATGAEQHLRVLRSDRIGLVRGGAFDRAAMQTVVELRAGWQDRAALEAAADTLLDGALRMP